MRGEGQARAVRAFAWGPIVIEGRRQGRLRHDYAAAVLHGEGNVAAGSGLAQRRALRVNPYQP